ncbi:MAG: AbrB/MazE/SpoVT family DNA-binding domain-containing protein [Myxococcota bacterium]
MQTVRVFKSGNSQAVRLPREFRFDESEVVIKKVGEVVLLMPRRFSAKALKALLGELGPLGIQRKQPEAPERP